MEGNFCLICGGSLCDPSKKILLISQQKKSLLTLPKAAQSRQDELAKNILRHKMQY